tara:strand:+ start:4966 stop:5190 length:225 start_codon:yes stop_codon:yes gene_type:complete
MIKELIIDDLSRAPKKYNGFTDYDGKKADVNIKYCCKCKKCWEKKRKTNGKIHVLHYEDFVTYGKEREVCDKCL